MKDILKEKKGITLAALVITIIVIIILAGIGMNVFVGDNGLISEFKNAKIFYEDLENKENKRLFRTNLQKILGVINKGQTAKDDRVYVDSNDDFAVIPKGFTVSNIKIKDGSGNIIDDETTIENGLVIYQTNGETIKDWTTAREKYNQYVWIPVEVEDLEKIFEEAKFLWNLCIETEVTTKYMTKSLTNDFKLGDIEILRTYPGSTAQATFREPDLIGTDTEERAELAGFSALLDGGNNVLKTARRVMAESLAKDYQEMIDSIKMYGGFYVGRFELGRQDDDYNKPMVRKGTVINWNNWYQNYKSCKQLNLDAENNTINSNVEIRMMWSCLWDQICRFVNTRGQKVDINDSRSYGNYDNSTVSTDINGFNRFNNTTGRSENWKTNNIYDLAGNCWERTQEAYYENNRVLRGGQAYESGSTNSIISRVSTSTTSTDAKTVVTRPVVYIKTKDLKLVNQRNGLNNNSNVNI